MTISGRNYFFKAGIGISIALLIGIAASALSTLPLFPSLVAQASLRSTGLVDNIFIHPYIPPAFPVPLITILASIAYAICSLSLIYYFFEKTQSPEILFVAFFSFSLAFESLRIMVPLQAAKELPGVMLLINYRILIFGRCFGIYSLFFASVCASGLEIQRYSTIILIIAAAAFGIALWIPMEGLSWDSTMNLVSGYQSLMRLVEGGIAFITMLSFLIAAYSRGTREYMIIGLGSLLASIGRALLINADTWITPFPGLAILALGTWFIGKELHRVYMWL